MAEKHAPGLGSLVRWLAAPSGRELGLVTDVTNGKRLRISFDHGEEKLFAWPNVVLERVTLPEGSHVQIAGKDQIGIVESIVDVEDARLYSVQFPGGEIAMVSEAGVRPAIITDPLQLMKSGSIHDARSTNLRLVGTRLLFAHQTHGLSSLSNSRVDVKPHQVWVTHRATTAYPHRFLLADEVGLGKTIEAGLILKELKAREVVHRSLVIAPSGIVSQWQFELRNKFNEIFARYNRETVNYLESRHPGDNVWTLNDQVVVSNAFASNNPNRRDEIAMAGWDMVIIDEAHHARRGLPRQASTNLYKLAENLAQADANRALLLLTATPLQLHRSELYSLIELLDAALFPSLEDFDEHCNSLAGLNSLLDQLRRWNNLTKEDRDDLLQDTSQWLEEEMRPDRRALSRVEVRSQLAEQLLEKHRLSEVMVRNRKSVVGGFMPRVAIVWPVEPTEEEAAAYNAVTDYCRSGYQVATATNDQALGFIMATFQKLNSSSSYAVKRSLLRRIEKLEGKALPPRKQLDIEEVEIEERSAADALDPWLGWSAEDRDNEVARLRAVVRLLDKIDVDTKTQVLLARLDELRRDDPDARIIIFTQSRDTQEYLSKHLADPWIAHLFHGGLKPQEKDSSVTAFRDGSGPRVLISTEAGGEGRNFQFCHMLINYDLPWNPMKIEQRIGRLDRIGQKHPVMVINFALRGTIEERVLDVLARRIKIFEETVGGLDPILGSVEQDLRKLFLMAEEEATAALERLSENIELRVAEARRAEERLADLIMDTKSFRQDETAALLDRRGPVHNDVLRRFVVNSLVELGCSIVESPPGSGIQSIKFRGQFLIDFPDLVKEGIVLKGTFDPAVARDHEDIDFFAFGHKLVDDLVRRILEPAYPGRTSFRRIRTESHSPAAGWFLTFAIELDGVTTSKEIFPVFIPTESSNESDTADWLLERAGRLRGEGSLITIPEEAMSTFSAASAAAHALATKHMIDRQRDLVIENQERAQKEHAKLDRFFDYRAEVAERKLSHADGVVKRLEASQDPDSQKILPVWRKNLENAQKVLANLGSERTRQKTALTQKEQVQARQQLISVSYVEILSNKE